MGRSRKSLSGSRTPKRRSARTTSRSTRSGAWRSSGWCRRWCSTLPAFDKASSRSTNALASTTIKACVQLCFTLFPRRSYELRARWHSLDRAPPADTLQHVLESRPVRDPRQRTQDELRHRDPFLGGANLQVPMELVRHVSYLDHFHGSHIVSCVGHELKGRTRRSAARAGVPEEALVTPRAPCRRRSARRAVAGSAERAPAADGRGDGAPATGEPALAAGPRAALPGGGPPAPPAPGRGPRAPRRSWCGWGAPGGA